jgi:hypothetical protein
VLNPLLKLAALICTQLESSRRLCGLGFGLSGRGFFESYYLLLSFHLFEFCNAILNWWMGAKNVIETLAFEWTGKKEMSR